MQIMQAERPTIMHIVGFQALGLHTEEKRFNSIYVESNRIFIFWIGNKLE